MSKSYAKLGVENRTFGRGPYRPHDRDSLAQDCRRKKQQRRPRAAFLVGQTVKPSLGLTFYCSTSPRATEACAASPVLAAITMRPTVRAKVQLPRRFRRPLCSPVSRPHGRMPDNATRRDDGFGPARTPCRLPPPRITAPMRAGTWTSRPAISRRSSQCRKGYAVCTDAPPRRAPSPCSKRPRSKIRATRRCLALYGRALAEAGNYEQALEVLDRAHTPDQPDWHILSAQGAVLDQMGRHADAQRYYLTALKIVPDEPSVLSKSWALLRAFKELARNRSHASSRRRAASGGFRGYGKTSRLSSACKAASPRPKASRAPTCPRTRPPPKPPI